MHGCMSVLLETTELKINDFKQRSIKQNYKNKLMVWLTLHFRSSGQRPTAWLAFNRIMTVPSET